MKRSERYYVKARTSLLWACAGISAAVCAGVWAARAALEDGCVAILSVPATVFVLAACYYGVWRAAECRKLLRMAGREARWEWEREVRPRL